MIQLSIAALLLALATWPSAAGTGAGVVWDLANGLGYAACLLLALVCVLGARGSPAGAGYVWHRDIGFVAVLLTGLHVLLLVLDPAVWQYLWPGAPAYMWAGLLACLPLSGLSFGAVRWVRRRWPDDAERFRQVHLLWTACALALVAWHVIGSGFYADRLAARGLLAVLLLGLPAAMVLARARFPVGRLWPVDRTGALLVSTVFVSGFVLLRTG